MSGDPYKYFRTEARELVERLTKGVLDLEKAPGDAGMVAGLLRYAHTLKGAARIVRQPKIAELSHSMEEVLAGLRERGGAIASERARQLLSWIDAISVELAGLDRPPVDQSAPRRPEAPEPGDDRIETVRVDVEDMDAMLRTISELGVQLSGLSSQANTLGRTANLAAEMHAEPLEKSLKGVHRALEAILERTGREVGSLHEQATAMRLVPVSSLFGLLERTARDAAEATGRQIALRTSGGDVRLDAHGLRLLRNALTHMVRNAVTHGIESPAERSAAGKPPVGTVEVAVQRLGDRAVFICADDGKGIDIEQVRQAAVARGLVNAAEAAELTPSAATSLLLRGGMTTMRTVSQLSGRGIGLDVVSQTVAALNGTVTAHSEPGKGMRIEISVPVMVELQEVLHLQAGPSVVSIPRQSVARIVRMKSADIAQSPQGQSILCDGQAVPFVPLGRIVKSSSDKPPQAWSVLVLRCQAGTAALGVDHVLGVEAVVIRSVPQLLGPMATVSGAFLNGEGNPQLVLSADGVVQAIHSGAAVSIEAPAATLPLLVIDDSLTTRMLEQGILETAGYEVDTASSGEEALEKARRRRYGVFIVDVEMPGMDGFEFIQAAGAEPELASIPAIVVTSRDTAEDRSRGDAVGARAYIVKGAFDEALLLRTIRELIG